MSFLEVVLWPGVILYLLMVISFFVAVFTVRVHFDKLFKNTYGLYDPQIPMFRFVTRTMNYMFGITIKHIGKRKSAFGELYGNYDFYSHATKLERLVSYTFCYSSIFLTLLGFAYIIKCKMIPYITSMFG